MEKAKKTVTMTVALPKACSRVLDEMVTAGLYSTKAEAIREAILSLIDSNIGMVERLAEDLFAKAKRSFKP
jgi:Arc/MetJ-type ribon-helix-helix transcriptional regulator